MTDTAGGSVIMPAPLSVRLRMEEDVPADDLYAVFPDIDTGELCRVTVAENDRVLFTGVVDEQERIQDSSGAFLRVAARSLAAHLLDNEAYPCTYDHPNARLICDRHIKGYGITVGDADDTALFGELNITKGMSQWGAVTAFCKACYSAVPRVTAQGVLYLKGTPPQGTAVFGGAGIPYVAMSDSLKRCEELSCVRLKLDPDGGYAYRVENRSACERGIVRERYLNAMTGAGTVRGADRMLEMSRRRSRIITLKCPGRHPEPVGKNAVIADRKDDDALCVSAIEYRLNPDGEYTVVKLRRRTESCGYPAM